MHHTLILIACIFMFINACLPLISIIIRQRRINKALEKYREEKYNDDEDDEYDEYEKKFSQIVSTDKLPDNTTQVYTEQGSINVGTADPFMASMIAQCFLTGEVTTANRSDYEKEVEGKDD